MDMPTSRADCVAAVERGDRLKFVFFWGHTPRRPGAVDASCLSQWFPATFTVDGVEYPTAEHFMMAEKARLFGDQDALTRVLGAATPGEAKARGREVRGFDERAWAEHRFDIVVRGSTAKFAARRDLREFLVASKNRVLVEASPQDRVWGIGLARDDERAQDPRRWLGLNLLGFALMKARDNLAATNSQ